MITIRCPTRGGRATDAVRSCAAKRHRQVGVGLGGGPRTAPSFPAASMGHGRGTAASEDVRRLQADLLHALGPSSISPATSTRARKCSPPRSTTPRCSSSWTTCGMPGRPGHSRRSGRAEVPGPVHHAVPRGVAPRRRRGVASPRPPRRRVLGGSLWIPPAPEGLARCSMRRAGCGSRWRSSRRPRPSKAPGPVLSAGAGPVGPLRPRRRGRPRRRPSRGGRHLEARTGASR